LLIGATISIVVIYSLICSFDMKELEKLIRNIEWKYVILILFSNLVSFIPYAFRWYYLLDRKITLKTAYTSSIIAVGLNLVLPARGGDLIRLMFNKKESSLSFPNVLSKLFFEKIMDFGTVVIIGLIIILKIGIGKSENLFMVYLSGFILLCILSLFIFVRFYLLLFRKVLRYFFSLIRKESFYDFNLDHHLSEISNVFNSKKILYLSFISLTIWIFAYPLTYWLTGRMIGISLGYGDILFLLFIGAMGAIIPSLPSGIGVFHASMIYGFKLLGKNVNEGLFFATIFHLLQIFLLLILTFFCYVQLANVKNPQISNLIPD
jgi:glycosyltransferase 2 family protein